MPPKPTGPPPSGGLARFGFAMGASSAPTTNTAQTTPVKKSLFDDEDDFASFTSTTSTTPKKTPTKTTQTKKEPVTTPSAPKPTTANPTPAKSVNLASGPDPTPTKPVQSSTTTTTTSSDSTTTTPVKKSLYSRKPSNVATPPPPLAPISSPAPPSTAQKHVRPVYDETSDDEIIVKRPGETAVANTTPVKRTNVGQNVPPTAVQNDKNDVKSPQSAGMTTKKAKFHVSSSSDGWSGSGSGSDDDSSSDDYSSDDGSESESEGSSSFVSESEDDVKNKRGSKTAKTAKTAPKRAPGAKKGSVGSKSSFQSNVSISSTDDEPDGKGAKERGNGVTDLPSANGSHQSLSTNFSSISALPSDPRNISSFVNTGRPVANPLFQQAVQNAQHLRNGTQQQQQHQQQETQQNVSLLSFVDNQGSDSEEDGEESPQNSQTSTNPSKPQTNQSSKSSNTTTVASHMGDYELPHFVLPENIKDKQGRRPKDPNYNPRTLFIPPNATKDMTPAQQQFWEIKSQNMDIVLLFKVGKFYELFDLDAEVGIKELGLLRMGSDKRLHAGFPEMGYVKYTTQLVQKGYRVACAEQVQTPEQLKEYNDKLPKGALKQKVVKREICSMVTPGTGVADEFLTKPSSFLLSVVELPLNIAQATTVNAGGDVTFNRVTYSPKDVVYGIAYVDTATGAFTVGSFVDSTNKTSLRALLAQIQPSELLYYRSSFSAQTDNIIQTEVPADCLHTVIPVQEKLKTDVTIAKLAQYFKPYSSQSRKQTPNGSSSAGGHNGVKRINPNHIDQRTGWPKVLFKYKNDLEKFEQENDDENAQNAQNGQNYTHRERQFLFQSFWESIGLVTAYLQRTLLDKETIPLCRFKLYKPIESSYQNDQNDKNDKNDDQNQAQNGQICPQNASPMTSMTDSPSPTSVSTTSPLPPLPPVNYDCENENLVLDSQTLTNLEILVNSDGNLDGTLIKYLDHCHTAFGKRLIRRWVCSPLFRTRDINMRLDAVEELLGHFDVVKKVAKKLDAVPDLERQLARIRANSLKKDVEAIMYVDIGKIKVELFLKCLKGFEGALEAIQELVKPRDWCSPLLKELLFTGNSCVRSEGNGGGEGPDGEMGDENDQNGQNVQNGQNGQESEDFGAENQNLFSVVQQLLREFRDSFDSKKAMAEGKITPKLGVVDEYDDANAEVAVLEQEAAKMLQKYRGMFGGASSIQWAHKNKETFQLEVPIDIVNKYSSVITNKFEQVSSTTKLKRFYTAEIKELAKQIRAAEENRETVLKDVTRQVFEKFSLDFHIWSQVVESIANIDCLLSLATASHNYGGGSNPSCRPSIIDVKDTPEKKPLLKLRNSIHPTVAHSALAAYNNAPKSYIPNDVDIGTDENPSRFVIVSGPNMGGKSTLLRQVCCCIILAQIGCFVPAEEMVLTPIDRIFTRVGASDRLIQGQSTFLVELEETSGILRHATPRSFVILDELGRGTSTFDGTAIAHSVVQFLSRRVQCLTLFTTHYHMLLQEYKNNPLVSMYHMAYKANTNTNTNTNNNVQVAGGAEESGKGKHAVQSISFTYKFLKGVCNKSFGLHVAALAKLPGMVIDVAYERGEWFSASFEQTDTKYNKMLKRFIIALYHNDISTLRTIKDEFENGQQY